MCWCPHADEDFGGDVEIPEEVQAQLLEDYERECEENRKKPVINSTVRDESQIPSDTGTHISSKKNAVPTETKSDTDLELLEELKVDLSKTSETSSKPSPSSTGK